MMTAYLFSCENATCTVPEAFRGLFKGAEDTVTSPRGWEPGALNLAQACAMRFRTPLQHSDVTRLLVDIELEGDSRWSEFSMQLSNESRAKLVDRHVKPYRLQLRQRIEGELKRNALVLHVLVHTGEAMEESIRLETVARSPVSAKVAEQWLGRMRCDDFQCRHVVVDETLPMGMELLRGIDHPSYAQVRLIVSQSFFLQGKPWGWAVLKKHLLDSLDAAVRDLQSLSDPASSSTAPD